MRKVGGVRQVRTAKRPATLRPDGPGERSPSPRRERRPDDEACRSPAEILVVQHCHHVRPEVVEYLQGASSNFRHVRRFMILNGPDTYRLLAGAGLLG